MNKSLHGSINHVAITVSDLGRAMGFFRPMLEFLGYEPGAIHDYARADARLCACVNHANGTGVNVWEAKGDNRLQAFDVYAPGLHHLAFNVASHRDVDKIATLVASLGAEILDGPAEYPYEDEGYYAVFFLGPDRIKFEVVHMPGLSH